MLLVGAELICVFFFQVLLVGAELICVLDVMIISKENAKQKNFNILSFLILLLRRLSKTC